MKYLSVLWAGLWRKRTRSILTMLSLVSAFLLFGVLQGINQGFNSTNSTLDVERFFVSNESSMRAGLPLSYLSRLESVPGVRHVTHLTASSAFYQEPRNDISIFATDPERLFALLPLLKIAPEQRQAMLEMRTAAIVNRELAARHGWKVGQRIPIHATMWTKKDGSPIWYFDIVGIFDASAYEAASFFPLYVNSRYVDEARAFGAGRVTLYYFDIEKGQDGAAIPGAVDAVFRDAIAATKTRSEQGWLQERIKQLANINVIVNSIVAAVLFALLFMTSNTMMQSVQERVPEFAVLRAIGFSDPQVAAFIFAEAGVLCIVSAGIGLVLARMILGLLPSTLGLVSLSPAIIVAALGIASVVALVSAIPPALTTLRTVVIEALAVR